MTDTVGICNLALQKLGETPIVSLNDNKKQAKELNRVYDSIRDQELRRYFWKFAKDRKKLAPLASDPLFEWKYAYNLPVDYLRLYTVGEIADGLTCYEIEGNKIYSNDGPIFYLKYIKRVTDPTLFDPLFVEALASRLAWQCCEVITQSNTKKDAAERAYKDAIEEAKRVSALEVPPQKLEPEDEWLVARF